jgi:hypothetical protein
MAEGGEENVEADLAKKGPSAAEDFDHELQNNTSAFEALERDFQEVSDKSISTSCIDRLLCYRCWVS